jgi:fission process protein 1
MRFFGRSKDDKKPEVPVDEPREREGASSDLEILPPRKKLPKGLQETLDSEEKMWEVLVDGK